jgi:uncharacterized membrane protein
MPSDQHPAPRTDRQLEVVMGNLLRAGVLLSAAVVASGAAIYLVHHGTSRPAYHVFEGEPADLRSVTGIVQASLTLQGRGMIQLGLLLLVATPIARVVFSWLAFLRQRDWLYVVVTTVVLAALAYSLFGR